MPLTEDVIEKNLSQIKEWQISEGKLCKTFEFLDFITALKFVNGVGKLAENEGHHPDISIFSYKNVKIELWTHAIGGLSMNDFILAAKIDECNK